MVQYWVIVFSKLVVLQTKVNFRKVNKLADSILADDLPDGKFSNFMNSQKCTPLEGRIYNPCPFLQDKV